MSPTVAWQKDKGMAAIVQDFGDAGQFLIVCEHAGRVFPGAMNKLGLQADQAESHIAWDIGAKAVAEKLAKKLECKFISQRYSRLVYDCNRPPDSPQAMRDISEDIVVTGNQNMSRADRNWRIENIYKPFHTEISTNLDAAISMGQAPFFITVHSFTPLYHGIERHMHLGVLYDEDTRLADLLLAEKPEQSNYIIERNEPYGPDDGVTHTLKLHAISRGLPNVMFEIRNDLIRTETDQENWAGILSQMIMGASHKYETNANERGQNVRS